MMASMVMSPVIVWRQGHGTDDSADPIVRKAAAEKRAVAAIVLDHEETDEQARRGHREQEANPIAVVESRRHQSPDGNKGRGSDHQLENAARGIRLAISGEQVRQGTGFRLDWNHFDSLREAAPLQGWILIHVRMFC